MVIAPENIARCDTSGKFKSTFANQLMPINFLYLIVITFLNNLILLSPLEELLDCVKDFSHLFFFFQSFGLLPVHILNIFKYTSYVI